MTIDALRFEELVAAGRSSVATDPAVGRRAAEDGARVVARGRAVRPRVDERVRGAGGCSTGRVDEAAATELWVEAEMALGHDVLGTLDDLVARYPLREHLAAMRMLALYRAGRQADALTAYRTLRQTLDDELGIQPSAEVESLHQRVLQQDPSLDLVLPAPPDGDSPRRPRHANRPRPTGSHAFPVAVAWWAQPSRLGGGHRHRARGRCRAWWVDLPRAPRDVTPLPPNSVGPVDACGLQWRRRAADERARPRWPAAAAHLGGCRTTPTPWCGSTRTIGAVDPDGPRGRSAHPRRWPPAATTSGWPGSTRRC